MRVWNRCCGNEKRKLMKTSKSSAEHRPSLASTTAVSSIQSGDPLPALASSFPPPATLPFLMPFIKSASPSCSAQVDCFVICSESAVSPPPVFHSNRTTPKNHITCKYILSAFLDFNSLWGKDHGFVSIYVSVSVCLR